MFDDMLLAQSAVDRFKNNAFDLVIEGESYRLKLKPKLDAAGSTNSRRRDPLLTVDVDKSVGPSLVAQTGLTWVQPNSPPLGPASLHRQDSPGSSPTHPHWANDWLHAPAEAHETLLSRHPIFDVDTEDDMRHPCAGRFNLPPWLHDAENHVAAWG